MPPTNQQPTNPNAAYDFIMSPQQQPKRRLNTTSTSSRILVVVGGLFILVVIVVVLMKLLGGGGGLNKKPLLSVAQDQTEIMRLADSGKSDAVSQGAKNFAINAKLTVGSQQSNLLTYLADRKYTPKDKDLALKQSATSDSELQSALTSSTYDSTYKSIMKQLLATYQQDLTTAYTDAGPQGKTVLKKDYDGTQLLVTQLDSF